MTRIVVQNQHLPPDSTPFWVVLASEKNAVRSTPRSDPEFEWLLVVVLRDFHASATVHRGLVRADAGSRPAGRPHRVRPGQAFLHDAADELVHHVRVRPVMAAALHEG